MPTRAERRHREEVAKAEAKARLRGYDRPTTRHAWCDCPLCTGETRDSRPDFDVRNPNDLYQEKP